MSRHVPLVTFALLAASAALAESVTPPTISPPDSWVSRQSGTLRVLDKLDSTVKLLTLRVGETVHLHALSLTLQACASRPPDLPRDAAARLLVTDEARDGPPYQGWILQNEPGINMFEHPVYDIKLADCA